MPPFDMGSKPKPSDTYNQTGPPIAGVTSPRYRARRAARHGTEYLRWREPGFVSGVGHARAHARTDHVPNVEITLGT